MFYYFVWVRSNRYHGHEALTYSSKIKLAPGNVVDVELQRQTVMAVVVGATSKPRFKTKPVSRVYDLPALPAHLLKAGEWLKQYYPAPVGVITQQMLPSSLSEKQLSADPLKKFPAPKSELLPKLTVEQTKALANMQKRDTYVLHGITGSGKTRIYIELALETVAGGRSAIILTPEISLTTQLADSFRSVFGERVIVMHSGQAPSERQKAWLDCLRSDEPVIVVGPRSALFSPIQKPGLIVIDESHETAYKQEQSPQYQTGRIASYLAQITPSRLVLGSATPSVSDYYLAQAKSKPIIELKQLANPKKQLATEVVVVDRKEHGLFTRSPYISQPLIKAIESALARGEQSLLYLNRRGTARLIMCENCGWQALCPNCDVPLTYHGDSHDLRCHSCSYNTKTPTQCPDCSHNNIIFKTAGTKAIVSEIERIFPNARVARFDTDNAKADRFDQNYAEIKDGKIDILIGTQLLAKGLDLPKLSTLGVLLADTSLYMPDFSAEERTFQLITQVLGRIGRGHVAGRAVIQTYHPNHPVIQAAVDKDYQRFYEAEIASRRQFVFPPFCYLLKLTARRATIQSAETAAAKLKDEIESAGHKVRIEGPAPSFYERFQNKFQWQLVVKAKDRQELINIVESLPTNWSYDLDPLDLL